MKIINRGFLIIRPKAPFFNWCNDFESEMIFTEDDDVEPSIYLIEEDFFDIEPIIKANFKDIFTTELALISDDESKYPAITEETFLSWFDVEAGTTVMDTQKSDLKRDDLY